MERINKNDLDLSSMVSEGEEGYVYSDGEFAYKIFKTKNLKTLNNKEDKLDVLNEIDIDNVVKPLFGIYDKERICGYAMNYIDEANNLLMMTKWSKMFDNNVYLDIFYNQIGFVSDTLKEIHNSKYKLIVGDFNASNIIIDKEFIPYLIDIDSWKVGKLDNDGYSYHYMEYLSNRNMVTMDVNENTDRLCLMLLSLIMPFENKCLDDMSIDEFEKKCDDIEGLSILHDYFIKLKEAKDEIPDVPYVGDVLEKKLTL